MTTDRRSVCSSIARIFAARQSSCGSSTVVFTFPDIEAARVTMAPVYTGYRVEILPSSRINVNTVIQVYIKTGPRRQRGALVLTPGCQAGRFSIVDRADSSRKGGPYGVEWLMVAAVHYGVESELDTARSARPRVSEQRGES